MDQSLSYKSTIRLSYANDRGMLGKITTAIGQADGMIGAVDIVNSRDGKITRDISVRAAGVDHVKKIVKQLEEIKALEIRSVSDRVFLLHLGGKIEVNSRNPVKNRDDLSSVYTPGVARVCNACLLYTSPSPRDRG